MRWSFFATGTWESPVSSDTAMRIAKGWLGGCPGAYGVVSLQRGPINRTYHVHLLIGSRGRQWLTATRLRGSWVKHGHVRIEPYTPTLGAVEYLVRQADVIE